MAEPNAELGRAVREALGWLDATPETAGALLGINARTVAAMCEGIVPMRSLVIRFAAAIGRHCEASDTAPGWWKDVDAWLALAGYSPRRDADPGHQGPPAARSTEPLAQRAGYPAARYSNGAAPNSAAGPHPSGSPHSSPTVPAPAEPLACEVYHPVYERKCWGDSVVHIFWILDRDDRRIYQLNIPAHWDYRARAAQVKQDLQSLTRSHFERKYGRFRVNER
jgi:hypothetical protein